MPDSQQLSDEIGPLIKNLSPASFEQMMQALENAYETKSEAVPSQVLSDAEIDALDNQYCWEVVNKLEKIVSRASRLQKLEIEKVPKRNVQVCFAEAHRCYLYGFRVASAVMCREQ